MKRTDFDSSRKIWGDRHGIIYYTSIVYSGELDGLGEGNFGSVALPALFNPLVTQLEKVMPSDGIYVPQRKNDITIHTSYSKPTVDFEYVDNGHPSANQTGIFLRQSVPILWE